MLHLTPSVSKFYFHQWLCANSLKYRSLTWFNDWTAPGQLFVSAIKWVCVLLRIFCLFVLCFFSKKDGHLCKNWNATMYILLLHQIHIFWLNCSSTNFFCEIVLFLLHISKMHKCRISTALFCVDFNFFLSLSLSLIFILFYFNVLSLICWFQCSILVIHAVVVYNH